MLYAPLSQTVVNDANLAFSGSDISSPTSAITISGTEGLSLAPGRYLVNFVSDASITEAGTIGAALALNGAALPYAETAITGTDADAERIALSAIISPTAQSTLTVLNNSGSTDAYENSTLTVVKLA